MARINLKAGSRRVRGKRLDLEAEELYRYMGGGAPKPKPAGSQSAGYHSDLSIPGYQPKTPTVAPTPSQTPTGPAGNYEGAEQEYQRSVRALPVKLPPPAAHLPAPLAPPATLAGSRPSLLQVLSPTLAALLAPAAETLRPALEHLNTQDEIERVEAELADVRHDRKRLQAGKPVKLDVDTVIAANPAGGGRRLDVDPLGPKTVGDVSAEELARATQDGTLKINARGRITTPEVRDALVNLKEAQRQAGPNVAQLAQQFPELTAPKIRALLAAERRTGTPAPLLASINGIESDFGRSTLPGVHSGQNPWGAAGPFQIGNGTGAAGDSWSQVAEELWGEQADQHDVHNYRDAALGAGQYLQTFPSRPATKDPSTWHDAAFSYNHADWYADDVVAGAEERLGLKAPAASPQAQQALRVAKQQARAEGINPTPFNGDVEGGGVDTVTIRADAKGMVDWAESAIGTQEGSAKAERWGSRFALNTVSQPWCANFVSNGLARRGITDLPSNPNYVPTYEEEWGKYAVPGGLTNAKPGDLLTFSGRHIGIYVGGGEMVSGNSSDEVNRTPIDSDLSMVIRPPYKGGKITVKETAGVPGSTASSALGGATMASSGAAAAAGGVGAAGGGLSGARPAVALTQLASPLAAGPVLPTDVAAAGDEHTESAAEGLLALLGEGGPSGRRPVL